MKWNELYKKGQIPSHEDIRRYLGKGVPLCDDIIAYLEKTYHTKPILSYSSCSFQPGWNIKYKKRGKALCTLYPMPGFFQVLVVVGTKEKDSVEKAMEEGLFTPYMKDLYQKDDFENYGKWLMIEVRQREVLNDLKELIAIRVPLKNTPLSPKE